MEAKTPKGHCFLMQSQGMTHPSVHCTLYTLVYTVQEPIEVAEMRDFILSIPPSTINSSIYISLYLLSFIPSIFYLSAYMLCSKNIKLSRIRLKELCQLSVQHWCRIKTIIQGVTQHFREVDGHKSSLYA